MRPDKVIVFTKCVNNVANYFTISKTFHKFIPNNFMSQIRNKFYQNNNISHFCNKLYRNVALTFLDCIRMERKIQSSTITKFQII